MIDSVRKIVVGSLLRRNIAYTFARQILASVAHLLVAILIARHLGPEGTGRYAMAILLPTFLMSLSNLGVGPATVYHVSRGDYSARQAVRGNTTLGVVVAACGTLAALPVVIVFGDLLFPGIPLSLLLLGLCVFPIYLLTEYSQTILQGLENFQAFNWCVLLPPWVTLVLVTAAIHVFGGGITEIVASFVIGQAAGLLLAGFFLLREIRSSQPKHHDQFRPRYIRSILNYGWKAYLSNMLAFLNYRADVFLVNFLIGPAATGVYAVAVQIAERLWMPSQAASTVLLPRLSAMHTDPDARLRLAHKFVLIVTTITASASLVAMLALHWLIEPLFGVEYSDALPAFLLLLPGIIASAGARVQANCIAAAGKPEWNTYVALGVVTANIVGNILLIPPYGIQGAACATSLAYLGDAAAKQFMIRQTRFL